jgi:preprotein translocase subunit YajC
MSIWNKILLGLIIVCLLGFFYMSARMLKTQKNWSILAEQYNKQISEKQKEDKVTEEGGMVGGKFGPGIEQVRAELNKLTVDRQRVWYKCDSKVDINHQTHTATIKVTVDQPNPSGIAEKSVIYVFEDVPAAQQGRYVGEFKVTAVADKDKQITLEPIFNLTPEDEKKLAEAKRPWNLYDSLPHDNHEILGELPAVDGKYVRPLRDYAYLFDAYHMKITELIDKEQAVKDDKQMVEGALDDARLQVQFYQKQGTVVKALLAEIARQRDAVAAHLDKLRKKFAEAKAAAAELIKNNKAMAGQIAKIQLDATRRIDERTRAMAQSANGEN